MVFKEISWRTSSESSSKLKWHNPFVLKLRVWASLTPRFVAITILLTLCFVGLGLAVVARIVEQLGGQLRVDSQLNEGSRFSFLLPLGTESEGALSSPSTASLSRSATRSRSTSQSAQDNQIDDLVQALSAQRMSDLASKRRLSQPPSSDGSPGPEIREGEPSLKLKQIEAPPEGSEPEPETSKKPRGKMTKKSPIRHHTSTDYHHHQSVSPLRVLIVEVRFPFCWST